MTKQLQTLFHIAVAVKHLGYFFIYKCNVHQYCQLN